MERQPCGTKRKKRSFLSRAKQYGKKGQFGRGAIVEEDVYHYFVRVWEVKKQGFETEEDKGVFVRNVFAQLKGKEIEYSSNQFVSRVVEELLPDATWDDKKAFMTAFLSNLRPVATNPYASYVLQQLIRISPQLDHSEERRDHVDFILKVSKFLFNNVNEFLWDQYANQVSRTALTSLSNFSKLAPELDCTTALTNIALKALKWPNFNELPFYELTSGLLQSLLLSIKDVEGVQDCLVSALLVSFESAEPLISTQFLEGGIEAEYLPPVLSSVPSTRLLESCIDVGSEDCLRRIFDSFFEGKVVIVAQSKNANLALQKLISTNIDDALFERIFQPLKGDLAATLEAGNPGVIHKLAEACLRFTTRQSDMMKGLEFAFGCIEKGQEREFFTRVLTLTLKGPYNLKPPTLHGSLILQTLLKFKKPIKVVNGLLSLGGEGLKKVLCDSKGSHLADTFMESEYVGEKSRERLIKALRGHYVDLAICKFGSRVVERLWGRTSVKVKLEMGAELLKGEATLRGSKFGSIIASNLSLQLLRIEPLKWKALQTSSRHHPKDLFKEIISP